ncbi:hypothetical protein Tco_0247489 [Tanacetum coccineum]
MAPTFVSSKLDAINHLARHGLVRGLPKLKFEKDHMCFACAIGLKVPVRRIITDNRTEFVNQTLHEYYEKDSCQTLLLQHHLYHLRELTRICCFNPLFDELLNPLSSVDHSAPEVVAPIDEVAAPIPAISTGSPSSTIVDQDAPSPRIRAIGFFSSGSIAAQMNMVDNQKDVDTPMVEKSKLDEDKEGKAVDPSHYRGMIGILLYLTASRPDLQFAIKSAAISSTKAEYIACPLLCLNPFWMRSQLTDYGFGFNKIPMYCDNKSATALCCNNYQLADIFTKALGRERIEFLINKLGMRSFTPKTLKQLADEVDE